MKLQLICTAVDGTRLGLVEELELPAEALEVGRSCECGLVLPDASVAPRHLRLVGGEAGCTAEDLGSRRGTFLNGRRLEAGRPVPLKDGDRLRLGNFEMQLLGPGRRPGPVPANGDSDALGASPALQVLNGPRAGELLPLGPGRRLWLGRGCDCHLQFADSRISRRHASIEFHKGRAWISDAGARNGVLVNGRRLRRRLRLRAGDEVRLGRLQLRYWPGAERTPGLAISSGSWREAVPRWWLPAACTAAGIAGLLLALGL